MTSDVVARDERHAPPRARLAFRVGVVGHRPDRLPSDAAGLAAVRARLAQALGAVATAVEAFRLGPDAGFYADEPPLLRANSPLAEGADRLFATEALRLGYQLCCIMPFEQSVFEADFRAPVAFEPNALETFRDLLVRAQGAVHPTVYELDGHPDRRAEAYEAAGRVVLNQSDLLIAVWDGGGSNGLGGTLETLREAIAFNIPTLWIDTKAPFGWKLLLRNEDLDGLAPDGDFSSAPSSLGEAGDADALAAAIKALVEEELGLPVGEGEAETREHLSAYLDERKPRFNFAFAWKTFRDLLDRGVFKLPPFRVADYVSQIEADWPITLEAGPDAAEIDSFNAVLRGHYAWSDKLADRYADAHRSGFIWSSLLAASAVFLALLPMAAAWGPRRHASLAIAVLEAVVLVLMVGLPLLARRRRWHQRWMEYRVLAEVIRELRILAPLGGGRPLPRVPAHLANYGDPTRSWMYWQVRAVARTLDLPNARVDAAYLDRQTLYLLDFVGAPGDGGGGQVGFHHMNCERLERLHRHLHEFALGLFLITIGGVLLDWLLPVAMGDHEPPWSRRWLIVVSAFFPALGAALASINNQGEFARLQRRSRAMSEGFLELKWKIIALHDSGQITLAKVTDLASRAAAMMVDENNDWRIVVLDLPHAAG